MGTAIEVREATVADIPGIARVQSLAGRTPVQPSSLSKIIAAPDRVVVVAVLENVVVAWAKTHYWSHSDGVAAAGHYLGGVTVSPKFRRNGVGRSLTTSRLEWIWKRTQTAWYVTNATNAASIALHRGFGFCEVARSDHFHTTRFAGEEGILFRLDLQ